MLATRAHTPAGGDQSSENLTSNNRPCALRPQLNARISGGTATTCEKKFVTAQSGDGIGFALPDDSTLALVQPRCKLLRHGF